MPGHPAAAAITQERKERMPHEVSRFVQMSEGVAHQLDEVGRCLSRLAAGPHALDTPRSPCRPLRPPGAGGRGRRPRILT